MEMDARIKNWLLAPVAIVGTIAFIGFGIESSVNMPDYAVVMVDDVEHEYYAPQCVNVWLHGTKKNDGYLLRRTTAEEAWKLKYKQNRDCNELGYFHPDGYRLTPLLLSAVGLLPPKKQWWDKPYRTEDGMVYPPDTHPRTHD
jgi:hypothetical protein